MNIVIIISIACAIIYPLANGYLERKKNEFVTPEEENEEDRVCAHTGDW